MNKIIKDYFMVGIICAVIIVGITLFLVAFFIKENLSIYDHVFMIIMLIILSVGMFLSGTISYNNILGRPLQRDNLKKGVSFRLEKIQSVGNLNESLYFIYKNNKKFLYTDIPEFENGEYIKIDGSLFKIENFSHGRE